VPCDGIVSGNFQYRWKDGTTKYWFQIQIMNHLVPIEKVEIVQGGVRHTLEYQSFNFWQIPSGVSPVQSPFSLVFTSKLGEEVTESGLNLDDNALSESDVVDGTVQFSEFCPIDAGTNSGTGTGSDTGTGTGTGTTISETGTGTGSDSGTGTGTGTTISETGTTISETGTTNSGTGTGTTNSGTGTGTGTTNEGTGTNEESSNEESSSNEEENDSSNSNLLTFLLLSFLLVLQ